jgi:hypothetical protein
MSHFTTIRSEAAAGLEKAADKIAPKPKALPIPAFGDFGKAANDVCFFFSFCDLETLVRVGA